jgi:hypothetical protein
MNPILSLQQKVITRLTDGDPALAPAPISANDKNVTWMTEMIGDLVTKVQKLTASVGIVSTVLTPGGDRLQLRDPSTGQLSFICPVVIEIEENVTANQGTAGTKIAALDLVVFCMRRLNFFELDKGQRMTRVTLDPKPFELIETAPHLVYHVRANAPLVL